VVTGAALRLAAARRREAMSRRDGAGPMTSTLPPNPGSRQHNCPVSRTVALICRLSGFASSGWVF